MKIWICVFLSLSLPGLASVKNLQSQLQKITEECRSSEQALQKIESEIEDLDKVRFEKTTLLEEKKEAIGNLLLALNRLKTQGALRIIQSKTRPEHMVQSLIALKSYIYGLQEHLSLLQQEIMALNQTTEISQTKKDSLSAILQDYQTKYQKVELLLKKREHALGKEVARRKVEVEKAQKVAKKAQNFSQLIEGLDTPIKPLLSARKRLAYAVKPVEGPELATFGKKHEMSPAGTGYVFRPRAGAHVLSPTDGTIVYAGPFRGYAQIIIIAHDDKYHTLLTGLHRIDVSVGQLVKAGEPLGIMNPEKRGFLYLELRNKKGAPVDPKGWFPK
jgi:septal ring factor EnvC (AmiA/AmiB activator)